MVSVNVLRSGGALLDLLVLRGDLVGACIVAHFGYCSVDCYATIERYTESTFFFIQGIVKSGC